MKERLRKGLGVLRRYGSVLYIALITVAVAVVLVCSNEVEEVAAAVRTLRLWPACIAACCVLITLLVRTVTTVFFLHRRGYRISYLGALGITGAGEFYSAITPSASGGQPAQVVLMRRMGIPTSISISCVSAKFLGFQASYLLAGAVLGIVHFRTLSDRLYGFRWLVALGFFINAGILGLVMLTLPKTRLVATVSRGLVRFGGRLHLIRDEAAALERFEHSLSDYREALLQLIRNPLDGVVILLLSMLEVLVYMSIPVWLYRAFGLKGTPWHLILALQLMLFIASAFIPLPGAAGASESGFCLFMRGVFPEADLVAAMLCWRFFSFYMQLLLGFALLTLGRRQRLPETVTEPEDRAS